MYGISCFFLCVCPEMSPVAPYRMLPNILDVLSMSLILWTSFQQGVLALSVLLSLLPYSFVTVVATSTKFSVSKSANSQALAAVAGVVDALRSITSVKLSCGEEYGAYPTPGLPLSFLSGSPSFSVCHSCESVCAYFLMRWVTHFRLLRV